MLIDFSGIVKPGTITKEESVVGLCDMPPQKSGERARRGNLATNDINSLCQRQTEYLVCNRLGRKRAYHINCLGMEQLYCSDYPEISLVSQRLSILMLSTVMFLPPTPAIKKNLEIRANPWIFKEAIVQLR
jgi:hypothetical protein